MDSKKVDKWLMIGSGISLVIGILIIFAIIGKMGSRTNLEQIIFLIGIIAVLFSVSYLVLSVLTLIFNLISKKLSNHFKAEVWFKMILSIIITIIIFYILGAIPSIG